MNARPLDPVAGPILTESPRAGRLSPPRPHVAVVVVYRRGDHEVMWPHARGRVMLSRRPTTLYEVDLSLHQADFEADAPSLVQGCPFRATLTIQWRVTDPSAVIRHRVTDAAEALAPHVLHRIRGITRKYDITETSAAEDEINEQLSGNVADAAGPRSNPVAPDGPGAEYGLWSRIIAQLFMDEAATEHHAKMAKLTWAIEEEKAEQELRLLQEQHQQRVSRRDTIDFVSHMVDSGVIERWQVNDEVKEALAWLREATTRVIPERQDDSGAGPRERRRGRFIIVPGESEPNSANTNGHASDAEQEEKRRLPGP